MLHFIGSRCNVFNNAKPIHGGENILLLVLQFLRIPLNIYNSDFSHQIIGVRWHFKKNEKINHFSFYNKVVLQLKLRDFFRFLKTFHVVVNVDCQIKCDFNWTLKSIRKWHNLYICCNSKLSSVFHIKFLIPKISFFFFVLAGECHKTFHKT